VRVVPVVWLNGRRWRKRRGKGEEKERLQELEGVYIQLSGELYRTEAGPHCHLQHPSSPTNTCFVKHGWEQKEIKEKTKSLICPVGCDWSRQPYCVGTCAGRGKERKEIVMSYGFCIV
jgi:hypothetical protein